MKIAKDKKAWGRVLILERDLKLLKFLLEQKFLTLDQIHRSFYKGSSLQMPRMRLRKLMHFGFVQAQKVYTEARQVYLLGRAGHQYLEAKGVSHALAYQGEIDRRVFEHDRVVTDLRLAFEKETERWISERELRRENPNSRTPDAVFQVRSKLVALEYENADKGSERYRSILLDHLDKKIADHVLYVVRMPAKLVLLPQILEDLQGRRLGLDVGRISFSLEKEALEKGLEAPAVNLKRGKTKIMLVICGGRD